MAAKQDIAMPPDLDLSAGWTLRVTAVSASGALVSGVNVSNVMIICEDVVAGTGEGLAVGPFMLVPGPNA